MKFLVINSKIMNNTLRVKAKNVRGRVKYKREGLKLFHKSNFAYFASAFAKESLRRQFFLV